MARDDQKRQYAPTTGEINETKDSEEALVHLLSKALARAAREEQQMAANARQPADSQENEGQSIDLIELFYRLLENAKYVIVAALICAFAGGFYAYRYLTPVYSSTAKLYVVGQGGTSINLSDLQIGTNLMTDYQEVFRTWEVHEMVREELGLNYNYAQLQSMLTVRNPDSTRVLYITVRNADPQIATNLANAYASAGKRFILETMDTQEPNLFSVALIPGTAMGTAKSSYIMSGLLIGTVLSMGVVVLLYILDKRPRCPEDITRYGGIPALAVIPETRKKHSLPKKSDS